MIYDFRFVNHKSKISKGEFECDTLCFLFSFYIFFFTFAEDVDQPEMFAFLAAYFFIFEVGIVSLDFVPQSKDVFVGLTPVLCNFCTATGRVLLELLLGGVGLFEVFVVYFHQGDGRTVHGAATAITSAFLFSGNNFCTPFQLVLV